METNLWNLKSCKERLGIRQRTQAHKRHLINLVQARSRIHDRNEEWKIRSLNRPNNSRTSDPLVMKENEGGSSRVSGSVDGRSRSEKSKPKFKSITKNLQTMSNISRKNRSRQIQRENNQMLNRLAKISSTLSAQHWMQANQNSSKYRKNILGTKYMKPDYSQEVTRIIRSGKATYRHLKIRNSNQIYSLNHSVDSMGAHQSTPNCKYRKRQNTRNDNWQNSSTNQTRQIVGRKIRA